MFTDEDIISFKETKRVNNIQKKYENCMEKLRQNNGLLTTCHSNSMFFQLDRERENIQQQQVLDLVKQKESVVKGKIITETIDYKNFKFPTTHLQVWIIEND
jgi:hypothetical protein